MTKLCGESDALPAPHDPALCSRLAYDRLDLGPRDLEVSITSGRQHIRLPGNQLQTEISRETECRLQLFQTRRDEARTIDVYSDPTPGPGGYSDQRT